VGGILAVKSGWGQKSRASNRFHLMEIVKSHAQGGGICSGGQGGRSPAQEKEDGCSVWET